MPARGRQLLYGKLSDSGINQVRRLCWHLIHRYAVPLPLNRGRLKHRLQWDETANVGRSRLSQTSSTATAVPLLLQGEGLNALDIRRLAPIMLSGLWSLVSSPCLFVCIILIPQ